MSIFSKHFRHDLTHYLSWPVAQVWFDKKGYVMLCYVMLCTAWFGWDLVGNHEDRFSHVCVFVCVRVDV